ncbi:MAG: hypothetical protein IPF52_14340 [Saprospiraceae bacterium]|nr:hypothetical protein [Saprospiraceae bacterium]
MSEVRVPQLHRGIGTCIFSTPLAVPLPPQMLVREGSSSAVYHQYNLVSHPGWIIKEMELCSANSGTDAVHQQSPEQEN